MHKIEVEDSFECVAIEYYTKRKPAEWWKYISFYKRNGEEEILDHTIIKVPNAVKNLRQIQEQIKQAEKERIDRWFSD